ncbi:Glyoxalase/Bleomycin resistance protein/Dihydroxybiphenyl dioxygenase [Auriculariales sp. MPI-PUGE-AT-0066]|nr:Glyoxalase/Bleomycin resistance protein/Dihydroxybiphenyl dioxygenase [Auriculariales sp. MPI-PUGE-AT-0066]
MIGCMTRRMLAFSQLSRRYILAPPTVARSQLFRTHISLQRLSRAFTCTPATRMPATAATQGFALHHTMIRVKDPKVSIKFYTEVLGMDLIHESPNSDFTLYFLGYDRSEGKLTAEEKAKGLWMRDAILELTHNHGTESDSNFAGYASGNTEPGRGFGHIAITVPDIEAACKRFEELQCNFKKRLTDGKMKNIAFLLDPDGYWVEVVPQRFAA